MPNIFADAVTGGYIAGNIAIIVIATICITFIAGGLLRRGDGGGWVAFWATVVLVVSLGTWTYYTWPPFAYEYHHWIDKTVTVEAIGKRQVSKDKSFFEKFVVRDKTGELYGLDDTRGALVKPGDTLYLRCKKAYQFGIPRSAHGWDCRWSRNVQ